MRSAYLGVSVLSALQESDRDALGEEGIDEHTLKQDSFSVCCGRSSFHDSSVVGHHEHRLQREKACQLAKVYEQRAFYLGMHLICQPGRICGVQEDVYWDI